MPAKKIPRKGLMMGMQNVGPGLGAGQMNQGAGLGYMPSQVNLNGYYQAV